MGLSHNDIIGPIHTKRDDVAAKALADAITTSRQGIGAPEVGMYAGRLDTRRLARLACKQTNVFTRPVGARPNRVNVTILVDCSISMKAYTKRNERWGGWDKSSPTRLMAASQVCRDLVEATDMLDWVTADVLAFTTGVSSQSKTHNQNVTALFPIWETGEETTEVDMLGRVPMGYTEEGYAIATAADEMVERMRPDEQGLVIILSDGAPSEKQHVKSVVEDCARNHIPVVSVAIVPSAAQPMMYGGENVIEYNGSSIALGYDMASVIGGVL